MPIFFPGMWVESDVFFPGARYPLPDTGAGTQLGFEPSKC